MPRLLLTTRITTIVLSLIFTPLAFSAAPTDVQLSISVSGADVSLYWSASDVDGYRFYYAPYPSADPITVLELGPLTEAAAPLPVDTSLYMAVGAFNGDGETYSNVEILKVRGVDVINFTDPTSDIDSIFYTSDGSSYTRFSESGGSIMTVINFVDDSEGVFIADVNNRLIQAEIDGRTFDFTYSGNLVNTIITYPDGSTGSDISTVSELSNNSDTQALIFDVCSFLECETSSDYVNAELDRERQDQYEKYLDDALDSAFWLDNLREKINDTRNETSRRMKEWLQEKRQQTLDILGWVEAYELPKVKCEIGNRSCAEILNDTIHHVGSEIERIAIDNQAEHRPSLEVSDSSQVLIGPGDMTDVQYRVFTNGSLCDGSRTYCMEPSDDADSGTDDSSGGGADDPDSDSSNSDLPESTQQILNEIFPDLNQYTSRPSNSVCPSDLSGTTAVDGNGQVVNSNIFVGTTYWCSGADTRDADGEPYVWMVQETVAGNIPNGLQVVWFGPRYGSAGGTSDDPVLANHIHTVKTFDNGQITSILSYDEENGSVFLYQAGSFSEPGNWSTFQGCSRYSPNPCE